LVNCWVNFFLNTSLSLRPICGGDGQLTAASSSSSSAKSPKNVDTCIAIAGLPSNNTIAVRKYCVPKAQGKGVKGAPTETWFVWYSEEWTHTLVELKFLDTISGDTVVALRNNKGGPLSTGPPEHFVSVHPRAIQLQMLPSNRDVRLFDVMYSTAQDRIDRLTLFKESSVPDVQGMDASQERILGITDMFVLPTGKGDGR